ncbi:tetratricopeptide repeat protein, partial [Acidobacteriota bacterium]
LILTPVGSEVKRFAGYRPPGQYLKQLDITDTLERVSRLDPEEYTAVLEKLREIERYAAVMPATAIKKLETLDGHASHNPGVAGIWERIVWTQAYKKDFDGTLASLRHLALEGPGLNPYVYLEIFSRIRPNSEQIVTIEETVKDIAGKAEKEKAADLLIGFSAFQASNGELDAAEETASMAIRKAPRHGESWLNLAMVAMLKGDLEKALTGIGKAEKRESTRQRASALKAMVEKHQGRLSKAEEILAPFRGQDGIEEIEDMAKVLGDWFEKNEKLTEAGTAHWLVANLEPEEPEALNEYGMALIKANGNMEEAIDILENAKNLVKEDGMGAHIWDSLAWAHYKKGDIAGALEAITESTSLSGGVPMNEEVTFHRGAIFAGLGLDALARENLERVASDSEPEPDDDSLGAQAYRELEKLSKKAE